jgi:predicted amidohydrolase YtcJ
MRWAEKRLGPERVKGAYAWRTMLNDGVALAFGTDWPVEIVSPMRGLHACVTRELTGGGPAGGWQPQEKISMDECIHAYTVGSAYAEFEEGKKGQIVAGQYADMIVLSEDVTKVAPAKIADVKVMQTIAGGKTVFERKQ